MVRFRSIGSQWLPAAVIASALAVSNVFLITSDGSPLRVVAALLFILLPGLAWAEFLLADVEVILRWMIGFGLGFALAVLAGLLLHTLPGPILLWQWVALVNLFAAVPIAGLLVTPNTAQEEKVVTRSRPSILLLLLSIVLLGAFFRFAELNYSEYQGDEIEAVAPAARAIEGYEDALTLQRRKAPAEVLLPMLMWRTTGVLAEGTARLPFAIAGLLTIPCCYVMGRRLLNPQAGLAAALIVALCGVLVAFSRVVQYQSIVVWMMALSLICAWEWYTRSSLRWAVLAGAFLGVGLLAHYDAAAVVPALAYVAAAAVVRHGDAHHRSRGDTIIGSLVMAGACLLVAGPFYFAYLADPHFGATGSYLAGRVGSQILHDNLSSFLHVTSFYNSFYYVVLTGLLAWTAVTWWLLKGTGKGRATGKWRWAYVWLSLSSFLIWLGIWRFISFQLAVAIFIALVACALVVRTIGVEQRSVLIWGGFAFLAFVFVIQSPGTHIYVIMLPLALLAGVGVATLWDGLQARNAKVLAVAAAAVAVMVFGGYLFAAYLRQDVKYWQDWPASRLSFYWMPEEYADPNGFAIFGMVHRSGWKAAGAWLGQDRSVTAYDSNEKPEVTVWYTRNAPRPSREEQDYCAQKPQTMLIADDLVGAADHYGVAPDYLADYQQVGNITQSNGKGIAIYSLRPAALHATDALDSAELEAAFDRMSNPSSFVRQPEPQHQVNANLDNKVLLLGYDLDCITPDGRVALTLYWQALADLSADYHVFVHVAGGLKPGSPAGIWGQSDGVPGSVGAPLLLWDASRLLAGQQGGAEPLPTSTWRMGQVIRDRRTIQIPAETPMGSYALIAGLYQLQTGERLKLLDADNQAIADHVELTEIEVPTAAHVAAGEAP